MLVEYGGKRYKVWWQHTLPEYKSRRFGGGTVLGSGKIADLVRTGRTACYIDELLEKPYLGVRIEGYASCVAADNFDKRVGRKVSLTRALMSLGRIGEDGKWVRSEGEKEFSKAVFSVFLKEVRQANE